MRSAACFGVGAAIGVSLALVLQPAVCLLIVGIVLLVAFALESA